MKRNSDQARKVQNYYNGMKTKNELGKIFNDADKAGKEYQNVLRGVQDTLKALATDRNFSKYQAQMRTMSDEAEEMLKNIQEGYQYTAEEIAEMQRKMLDFSATLDNRQYQVYNEKVAQIDDDAKESIEKLKRYTKAVKDTQMEDPFEATVDKLYNRIGSASQFKTVNLLENMYKQGGGSTLKSRDELAKSTGSRDVAYDLLSDFCQQNMDINKQVGKSVFGQAQSISLISTLTKSGVNSSTWMKKNYDSLVKIQEVLGENNILTQAIVDNTYGLKGGAEEGKQYFDAIKTEAKNLGINLSDDQIQGQIATWMETIRKSVLRQASEHPEWTDEQVQQKVQDEMQKAFAKGGQAFNAIINGNTTLSTSQIQSSLNKSVSQLYQENPLLAIGGYGYGSSPLDIAEANNRGAEQILPDDSIARNELKGMFSGVQQFMESEENARNSRLIGQNNGGGDKYNGIDKTAVDKNLTWMEQISNTVSNLFGQSKDTLAFQDAIEKAVANAGDVSKAVLGGVLDILAIQKVMQTLQVAIAANTGATAATSGLSALTGVGSTGKMLGMLGKLTPILIGITAVVSAVSTIASVVNDIKTRNAQAEEYKKGMSEEDQKETDRRTAKANATQGTAAAVGGAVGTGVGIAAGAKIGAAIGAAGGPIGAVGGAVIGGLVGLAAGLFGGNAIGKSSAKKQMEDVHGAGAASQARSTYYHGNINSSVYGDGGATQPTTADVPPYSEPVQSINPSVQQSKPVQSKIASIVEKKEYNKESDKESNKENKENSININNKWGITQSYGAINEKQNQNIGSGYIDGTKMNSARGWAITSGWPKRNDGYPNSARHHGVDFGISTGTKLGAATSGVAYADTNPGGYGTYVYEVGDNGKRYYYGHMSRQSVSKNGTRVKEGDLIGYSGNTGNSSGPHLHFEVRENSSYGSDVNPMPYFTQGVVNPGRPSDEYDGSGVDGQWENNIQDKDINSRWWNGISAESFDKIDDKLKDLREKTLGKENIRYLQEKMAYGGPDKPTSFDESKIAEAQQYNKEVETKHDNISTVTNTVSNIYDNKVNNNDNKINNAIIQEGKNQSLLNQVKPEDNSLNKGKIPTADQSITIDKSNNLFPLQSFLQPKNRNVDQFINQYIEKQPQQTDLSSVIKSMTNNFKSLEMVIQKVSAMEMQYKDLKDSIKPDPHLPKLRFS